MPQGLVAFQSASRPDQQPKPVVRGDHASRRPSSTAVREAASSIASGIPSRRRQISDDRGIVFGQRDTGRHRVCALDRTTLRRWSRRPAMAPARVVHRRPAGPRGWWRGFSPSRSGRGSPRSRRLPRPRRARSCRTPAAASRPSNAAATLSATLIARLLGDAEDGSHRVGHRGRIADGGQLDRQHPVREVIR